MMQDILPWFAALNFIAFTFAVILFIAVQEHESGAFLASPLKAFQALSPVQKNAVFIWAALTCVGCAYLSL